jgi:hypothetical protein
MGLGFVLLIWIVLCGMAAVPMGAALGYWSWRNGRRARTVSLRRALSAALLPFIWIPLGLAWFAAYAVYCEGVRGVDPGLGDSFRVPLANGYAFCMIDAPDHAYIAKGTCNGTMLVDGIRQVAMIGDLVAGASVESPGFVLDTRTGGLTRLPDSAAALSRVPAAAPLGSPAEFYFARRWGWQDGVAALLLVVSLGGLSWFWYRRFIRAPGERSDGVPAGGPGAASTHGPASGDLI